MPKVSGISLKRIPVIVPYSDGIFTVDQADDLAKYFIGPHACAWAGRLVARTFRQHYIDDGENSTRYIGSNWTEAFFRAGIPLSDRRLDYEKAS